MKIKVSNWRKLSDSDKRMMLEMEAFYSMLTNALRGTEYDRSKKVS